MRRAARPAHLPKNALTTGRVGSEVAVEVATSGTTTANTPAVVTKTGVETEGVDTEEVNTTFATAPVSMSVILNHSCELEEEDKATVVS